MTLTMYGIKNCDTVAKARKWLEDRGLVYAFHDYKGLGVERSRLEAWADELGWEPLLNRAGMTFRKLEDSAKQDIDRDKAIGLMVANPSMIKRPVLDLGDRRLVGFKPDLYQSALG